MKIITTLSFLVLLIPMLVFGQQAKTNVHKKDTNKVDSLNGKMEGNYILMSKKAIAKTRMVDSLERILESLRRNQSSDALIKNGRGTDYTTNSTVILAISVLVFGLIVIIAILLFLYKTQKGIGNYIFQSIGLIIVSISSLFLIVTGYDKDQITPVIGLFGTIVGFIFGSNLNSKKEASVQPQNKID